MSLKGDDPKESPVEFSVPAVIESDFGSGDAAWVHLLPSEVACDRVVFAAEQDEVDPEGYVISLAELRSQPAQWAWHLSRKTTRRDFRPAVEVLAEALAQRAHGHAPDG